MPSLGSRASAAVLGKMKSAHWLDARAPVMSRTEKVSAHAISSYRMLSMSGVSGGMDVLSLISACGPAHSHRLCKGPRCAGREAVKYESARSHLVTHLHKLRSKIHLPSTLLYQPGTQAVQRSAAYEPLEIFLITGHNVRGADHNRRTSCTADCDTERAS